MKRVNLAFACATAVVLATAVASCGKNSPKDGAVHPADSAVSVHSENVYAQLAKLPDWGGVWEPVRLARPEAPPPPPPEPPKLTPHYAAMYAAYQQKNRTTPGLNFVTPVANCVPPGVPGSMRQPYPIEFLFTPGRVTIAIETYSIVRRIYTDGSQLETEPDPSYQGTSVGHWEGDTLVVETAGILPETSPMDGILGHSDKMKITERISLADADTLDIKTTVEDPEVFTEPYTSTAQYARHRDWKIREYVCAQNNHDFVDEQGKAGFRLNLKSGEKE
jgi:hypothetical protein